jgi:hypothetical protein
MKIEEWKNAVDGENDKKAFPLQLCKGCINPKSSSYRNGSQA